MFGNINREGMAARPGGAVMATITRARVGTVGRRIVLTGLAVWFSSSVALGQVAVLRQAKAESDAGTKALQQGQLSEAIKHLEAALEIIGQTPGTELSRALNHYFIGATLTKLGRYQDAIAEYEAALELYQKTRLSGDVDVQKAHAGCHVGLGVALGLLGRHEEAVDRLRTALAIYRQIPGTERERESCRAAMNFARERQGHEEEPILDRETGRKAAHASSQAASAHRAEAETAAGFEAEENGRIDEAIKHWEIALAVYEKLPETVRLRADLRYIIAVTLELNGRHHEAITDYRRALALYERTPGSETDRAKCRAAISHAKAPSGDMREGVTARRAELSNGSGKVQREESNNSKDDSETAALSPLADKQRANREFNAGLKAYSLRRTQEAVVHWKAALAMYEKIPGTERERAGCHGNIGAVLWSMERYKEAMARHEKALAMFEKIVSTERERANCHVNIGVVLAKMDRYGEAKANYEKALSMYGKITGTNREQATCHLSIGEALGNMGRYEEAMGKQEKALAMFEKIGGTGRERAGCHGNIGAELGSMGRYEEAIGKQEKALAMYEKIAGTGRERAGCYVNIGAALDRMARYQEAIARYERALAIYQKIVGTKREQATCHKNMGVALSYIGRYEQAMAKYEKALATFRKVAGAERERADCHRNIGVALQRMTRYDDATARYENALAMYEKIAGSERDQAKCLANMAEVLRGKGRLAKAASKYRVARRLGWAVWINTGLARTLEAIGSVSQLDEASRELVIAVLRFHQRRSLHYGTEARMAASARIRLAYAYLARFLVNRSREGWELKEPELIEWATAQEPGVRCVEAAFHYADAGKARTLTELIQQRPVEVGQDAAGQKLVDEDRQLLAQIGSAHQRKLALPSDAEVSRKELDDQIAEWQQRRRQIEYELKKTYVGRFATPEFQKAAEIQASLPGGIAILQYVVTEDDSRLIMLTKGRISGFDIPVKEEAPWEILAQSKGRWDEAALIALASRFATEGSTIGLEGLVRLYRAPMDTAEKPEHAEQTLPETMVQVGQELSEALLPPEAMQLLSDQKIKHLVVIPDGPLHLVPFAALPVDWVGSAEPKKLGDCRFLIEDYVVSYLPSWAMLGAIRLAAAERKPSGRQKELLALADPVFGKDDPRVKGEPVPEPIGVAAVLRSIYENHRWKRLPETEREARRSGSPFGKVCVVKQPGNGVAADADVVVYVGCAATPKVLEQADQYRRLLLATHGLADPGNAWLSCVALSALPEQGYAMPAYMKAADIIGLKLNADLVTLSACQTGLGRLERGEGLVGLSSAFFVAGARSLALTLWSVPSGETAEITVRFHELLKGQPNKAEALRQAQLEFLQSHPDNRHPFWWAAFSLSGDWMSGPQPVPAGT